MAQHAKTADAQEHVVLALPTTRGRVVVIEMPKGMIAMQCSSETVPCPSATAIEVEVRDRDFTRAVPQLRRFAARLLSTVFEVEAALAQAREAWLRTEGAFDAPIRHLLRIVAETCIERQREITRAMPGPTDEERAFLAIADAAEVSLLIAVNRLPRRARKAFVASVLGRSVAPDVEQVETLECAQHGNVATRPSNDGLQSISRLPSFSDHNKISHVSMAPDRIVRVSI